MLKARKGEHIFSLEPPCPPGNWKSLWTGERVTCDVSLLLLYSCQTRVGRNCDSLDTFYGEMIHWLSIISIIYFIFDINQKKIISDLGFEIWDLSTLSIFIFAVKYFPFIFSISGSRIVIIVSFIFTNFTKYKRFIENEIKKKILIKCLRILFIRTLLILVAFNAPNYLRND